MDALRRLLAQFQTYWRGLGVARRAGIVAAVAGVVAALAAVVYFSPGTRYLPLYRELAPEDVGPIRTALTGASIPVQLGDGGTAVLVPEAKLAEARVAVGAAGLPTRGGKGYEVFDENTLTMTPFVQTVNYQRALQAELARSVAQIEPVQSARVLIARPEPTPFVRDQKAPTASVVLKLKPGTTMSRANAAAIVSLVARSVEGLKPENVTVVDSTGRLLSDPHAGNRDDLPAPQLEYRQALETYLSTKAQDLLTHYLGAGRAVVRVSADVNFQKLKEQRVTYSPTDRVAVAERSTTSKATGASAGGVAGATSNVARAGGALGGGSRSGGGGSSEEVLQTDYLVSKTTQDIEDRMGAVTRLTVAAIVDQAGVKGENKLGAADIQELVKQATGFKVGRDEIKLSTAALIVPETPEEGPDQAAELAKIQTYVGIARNICLALAVVMAGSIVPLALLRRRAAAAPTPAAEAEAAAATAAEDARRARVARLTDFARDEPDRAAAVLGMLLGRPPQ
ncbi:flagellar M-ring protein FliF [bacterium]|nr:flagellar M-ring protein FliF [bacterium]